MLNFARVPRRLSFAAWALLAALLLSGCCCPGKKTPPPRAFSFERDTFSYPNELVWEYLFDDTTGKTTHRRREPPATYSHHCFVVVRAAKQFFLHARFDPALAAAEEAEYRKLVRRVVHRSPRCPSPPEKRIVIPGHADLRSFSAAHDALLKAECGGAWESYFQRGHWRMIFPFRRAHQEKMAARLAEALRERQAPVVHVVRFPSLAINHALLLCDVRETESGLEFAAYDPNKPERPAPLTYDRATRTFSLPRNDYWPGGPLDVYEVYEGWNY
jgi:hypothetical protein